MSRISIIVNCHNGEKYLKKSIQSILNQSYKNWEIIFFDNVSTDTSENIIKSYNDKRIKYYKSKKYLNLYKARNEAIKKTTGNYIAFLDVDDWWDKNKLTEQFNFLKKNKKYKFVCTNFYLYSQNKKELTKKYKLKLPSGEITQDLLNEYFIAISSVLLDREIFKLRSFKNKYNIIGDFDFFINLSKSHLIGVINKPLLFARIHGSNTLNKNINSYYKELKNWFKNNEKGLLKKKYNLNKLRVYLIKLKIQAFFGFFKRK